MKLLRYEVADAMKSLRYEVADADEGCGLVVGMKAYCPSNREGMGQLAGGVGSSVKAWSIECKDFYG